ncbi:MAG: hypothetical protein MI923_29325 [Phycisphaerales bacterium]|nr:hypothetical protein [Phycisphaerales bacterium]
MLKFKGTIHLLLKTHSLSSEIDQEIGQDKEIPDFMTPTAAPGVFVARDRQTHACPWKLG